MIPALLLALPLPAQEPAPSVLRLDGRPGSIVVTRGESIPFEVVALDRDGRPVDAPVRVTGPRRAVQVGDGVVTGLAVGEHVIVATLVGPGAEGGPVSLRVPVRVQPPPVERVDVTAAGRRTWGTVAGGDRRRSRSW